MSRVCVCDDDYIIVVHLRTLLEADGHEVVGCADPMDALAMLEADHTIKVFISDFHMPAFSGLEVLEIVRQRNPLVRRVLCTAAPGEPEVRDAVRSGLVHFLLEKPFSRQELRKAVPL